MSKVVTATMRFCMRCGSKLSRSTHTCRSRAKKPDAVSVGYDTQLQVMTVRMLKFQGD